MRDLVLIPSFFRPEYLFLCLEHILKAAGGSEKEIWVSQDRKIEEPGDLSQDIGNVFRVVSHFSHSCCVRYIERKRNPFNANVYNVLELYKEAYVTPGVRFVYLIEDDVLIAPDFFVWHEAVNERGDYFCSVGWHCSRNPGVTLSDHAADYIESALDFSSIGVCWRRANLAPVIKHARAEY